jgi:hypothetical protein
MKNDDLNRAIVAFKKHGGRYQDALQMLSAAFIDKKGDAGVVATVQAKVAQQALKHGSG